MDLRCPQCSSTDLKKVSLAYQEGLFQVNTRTRMLGLLFASGRPDIMVGRATTRSVQQTALSKSLVPPRKWSYLKLVLWSAAISFVALVVYIHAVMASSSIASSLPAKLYALIGSAIFASLMLITWRHTHSKYREQYAQWDHSFVCETCGTVTEQR